MHDRARRRQRRAHRTHPDDGNFLKPKDEKKFAPYSTTVFAEWKCAVLHMTDRKVADSPELVVPLKDATGVYLNGGRQWRLADAELVALTLKEIFGVLDRR